MYPINKYKYVMTDDNRTIAISSYAGRTVRGIAKMDPRDEYNEEYGKELAAARCAKKVAKKRRDRAARQVKKAADAYNRAYQYFQKMKVYQADADSAYQEAAFNLIEVETRG